MEILGMVRRSRPCFIKKKEEIRGRPRPQIPAIVIDAKTPEIVKLIGTWATFEWQFDLQSWQASTEWPYGSIHQTIDSMLFGQGNPQRVCNGYSDLDS